MTYWEAVGYCLIHSERFWSRFKLLISFKDANLFVFHLVVLPQGSLPKNRFKFCFWIRKRVQERERGCVWVSVREREGERVWKRERERKRECDLENAWGVILVNVSAFIFFLPRCRSSWSWLPQQQQQQSCKNYHGNRRLVGKDEKNLSGCSHLFSLQWWGGAIAESVEAIFKETSHAYFGVLVTKHWLYRRDSNAGFSAQVQGVE